MGNYAYNKTKIMNIGHSLICLYLLFGFGYLPAFGALNTIGMKVLGVFLGMLYGWTFIGFIWPSMIGIIALGLSGYATVQILIALNLTIPTQIC